MPTPCKSNPQWSWRSRRCHQGTDVVSGHIRFNGLSRVDSILLVMPSGVRVRPTCHTYNALITRGKRRRLWGCIRIWINAWYRPCWGVWVVHAITMTHGYQLETGHPLWVWHITGTVMYFRSSSKQKVPHVDSSHSWWEADMDITVFFKVHDWDHAWSWELRNVSDVV